MTAVEVIRAVLKNASAVTTLVPATRITPLRRPQGFSIPAITLQEIAVTPFNALTGYTGLDMTMVQLDAFADQYTPAHQIAAACRTALEAAGHLMQSQNEGYEPDTDPELYRVTQTWSVFT